MAPFWLEDVAHEAVPPAFVLGVAQVEAPEDGDLPGVGGHALEEGPQQQEEKHVEKNE